MYERFYPGAISGEAMIEESMPYDVCVAIITFVSFVAFTTFSSSFGASCLLHRRLLFAGCSLRPWQWSS